MAEYLLRGYIQIREEMMNERATYVPPTRHCTEAATASRTTAVSFPMTRKNRFANEDQLAHRWKIGNTSQK